MSVATCWRRAVAFVFRVFWLMLPVVIPSWRFFDVIAPSPRIEFAWSDTPEGADVLWREFRPRPASLTWAQHLRRLWWAPQGNESLYLLSCADRIWADQSAFAMAEIRHRLWRAVMLGEIARNGRYLSYRIRTIERIALDFHEEIAYLDPPQDLLDTVSEKSSSEPA